MIARLFVALALVCVGASACSNKEAVSYPGVAKLARALNANGIDCEGFEMTSRESGTPSAASGKGPPRLVKQAGDCSHGNSKLLLFTFRSSTDRDRWLTLGQLYDALVAGPNWAVSSQSKDVSDAIGDALGGDVTGGD